MNRLQAILVCLDQADPKWELPVPAGSEVWGCMIGWLTVPPPVDAGVPPEAARILSAALVKHAIVTFPRKTGRGISFVHAAGLEEAQQAFHDDYFDWSRRSQVIFLSPPNAPVPAVSERRLAHVAERLHRLADDGFTGVVLPGVDGDVAGVYTFTGELREVLLASLEAACQGAGAQFRRMGEDEFAEALAQS